MTSVFNHCILYWMKEMSFDELFCFTRTNNKSINLLVCLQPYTHTLSLIFHQTNQESFLLNRLKISNSLLDSLENTIFFDKIVPSQTKLQIVAFLSGWSFRFRTKEELVLAQPTNPILGTRLQNQKLNSLINWLDAECAFCCWIKLKSK